MKYVIGLMFAAAAFAGAQPPSYAKKIVYVAAEQRVKVAGVGGVPPQGSNELIPRDMDLGVRASMGTKPPTPPVSPPEVHSTFGHIYLIEDGEGTLVLGGTLVNPTGGNGGEWRGTAIEGGQEFHMKKGDMITVQVGMPHWWKEVGRSGIAYLAIHSFPEHK